MIKLLNLICYTLLLTLLSISTTIAQTYANVGTGAEESYIDISPAELQILLEELMQIKRKRMIAVAALKQQEKRYYRDNSDSSNVTNNNAYAKSAIRSTANEEALNRRISEMEILLLDMKQQLNRMETQESIEEAVAIERPVAQANLDSLQYRLQRQVEDLKQTVQEISVSPPPMAIVQRDATIDTIYQNNNQEYLRNYAAQMMELRQDVTDIETQMQQLVTKTDYDNLQKQLTRIEEKTISPGIIENGDDGIDGNVVAGTVSNAVLASQLAKLNKLVKEMKDSGIRDTIILANTDSGLEKNLTVVPQMATGSNNNDSLRLHFDTKFEELRQMIANIQPGTVTQIQPEIRTEVTKVVEVPVPANNTSPEPKKIDVAMIDNMLASNKKRQLFFGNDAFKTTSAQLPDLDRTVSLMQQYPSIRLNIIGFASATGSAIYNQSLSRRRAETAKKYLIRNGIDEDRIFIEFYGVDTNAATPADARRVDLVLMRTE